jgi:hypothetical protein
MNQAWREAFCLFLGFSRPKNRQKKPEAKLGELERKARWQAPFHNEKWGLASPHQY